MTFDAAAIAPDTPKPEFYKQLIGQAKALVHGERDLIANLGNISSLVYHALNDRHLKHYNWVGFYLMRNGELVLGPFQGRVACIRIKVGRGVCGTTAARKSTTIVPDVHEFEGHIACDSASSSEIVVPLVSKAGDVLGVFDLDCVEKEGFDEQDKEGLEEIVKLLLDGCDW